MVSDELTSAFKDYCAAVAEMADESLRGDTPSAERQERAAAAKLRLENARTLFELYVCRRPRQRPASLRQDRTH